MNHLVHGDEILVGNISESSIFDEEISSKNRAILQEDRENVDVGVTVGFLFERNNAHSARGRLRGDGDGWCGSTVGM